MKLSGKAAFKIDPKRRALIARICGVVFAALALFTLLAVASYLFTWQKDQSLLNYSGRMAGNVEVENLAGKYGFLWAHLLVSRWFGLGAFAIVATFASFAVKLLKTKPFPIFKAVAVSLTSAFLISFICSFFSNFVGEDLFFGGGLGGEVGAYVNALMVNLFGNLITLGILIISFIILFSLSSRRFSDWFISVGAGEKSGRTGPAEPADKKDRRKRFSWLKDSPVNSEGAVSGAGGGISEAPLSPDSGADPFQGSGPDMEYPDFSVMEGTAGDSVEGMEAAESSAVAVPGSETPDDEVLEIIEGEGLTTEGETLQPIDVKGDVENYRMPPLSLLEDYESSRQGISKEELNRNNYKIRATLKTYKIEVDNVKAVVGPTVTLYKVYPAPGVKISSIKSLQEDIAMALKADKGVRVVKLADSVGIEVANDHPSIVPLKAMLTDTQFTESKAELPVAIGCTITQKVKVFDLADAPHLLVAGATKQGKSVGLNVLITSLLYAKHPTELKFVFIDPKMVEFSAYMKLLKHYLAVLPAAAGEEEEMNNAIAKKPEQADAILRSLCVEMDQRYALLSAAFVNNIKNYNIKYKDRHLNYSEGHRYLPYIVVVVDEYADLTMSVGGSSDARAQAHSISNSIVRLAQKGRAAGIHVVLATQRPSVDVITGLIKTNFPTRIAFRVFSQTDSRTILDSGGAEKLIGNGDMIYYAGLGMDRVQCAYISGEEIMAVNNYIASQNGYKQSCGGPYYLPAPDEGQEGGVASIDMHNLDERFEEAARMVVTSQRGSTTDIQRRLGMGYARAGKVMDQLCAAGIVGEQHGSKVREVLVSDFDELERIIAAYKKQ